MAGAMLARDSARTCSAEWLNFTRQVLEPRFMQGPEIAERRRCSMAPVAPGSFLKCRIRRPITLPYWQPATRVTHTIIFRRTPNFPVCRLLTMDYRLHPLHRCL